MPACLLKLMCNGVMCELLLRVRCRVKQRKAIHLNCFSLFERKTRLEPTMLVGNISRIYVYTPTPERGEWGRFVRVIVCASTK